MSVVESQKHKSIHAFLYNLPSHALSGFESRVMPVNKLGNSLCSHFYNSELLVEILVVTKKQPKCVIKFINLLCACVR